MQAQVLLIPCPIGANALHTIPPYVVTAIKNCHAIFAENERTTRRFLKAMDASIVIDNYQWHTIHNAEQEQITAFKQLLAQNKTVAIVSEAGCPGIADPGQILVEVAQQLQVKITPFVGPSSILLALMASGLNGQKFEFLGYLPIDAQARAKTIKDIEADSKKNNSTKIFIETPYRNNQMLATLQQTLQPNTRICVAADITDATEYIKTYTAKQWAQQHIDLHKKPVIFLLQA
jgi:16S rRNA (cytidine1402-2'-O)-methyltransferase